MLAAFSCQEIGIFSATTLGRLWSIYVRNDTIHGNDEHSNFLFSAYETRAQSTSGKKKIKFSEWKKIRKYELVGEEKKNK